MNAYRQPQTYRPCRQAGQQGGAGSGLVCSRPKLQCRAMPVISVCVRERVSPQGRGCSAAECLWAHSGGGESLTWGQTAVPQILSLASALKNTQVISRGIGSIGMADRLCAAARPTDARQTDARRRGGTPQLWWHQREKRVRTRCQRSGEAPGALQ